MIVGTLGSLPFSTSYCRANGFLTETGGKSSTSNQHNFHFERNYIGTLLEILCFNGLPSFSCVKLTYKQITISKGFQHFSNIPAYYYYIARLCTHLDSETCQHWRLLSPQITQKRSSKQTNKQTNKQTHDEHSTRLIWLANNSGLNSIRYPSWDKVGVGQITSFLSFFIHFLHLRLNFVQEVAVIIVDKIESFHVLKVVAVVK